MGKGCEGLPDGFQQRAPADAVVASNQGQAFRSRGRANQAVDRIMWIVVRELSGKGGDFRGNGLESHTFDQPFY